MSDLGSAPNNGMIVPTNIWQERRAMMEREANEKQLNYLIERNERDDRLQNEINERMAHERIHYHPDSGKFVAPKYDILEAHLQLVKHPEYDLAFSTKNYPNFDALVAEKAEIPALSNKSHPDYARYEGMRRNIAVVRNFVLDQFFPDGKFDAETDDERKLELVPEVAEELGLALQRGKWWMKRPYMVYLDHDKANIEGSGAAEMYNALLGVQRRFTIFNLRSLLPGHDNKEWELPPVVDTPFSPANMLATLPEGASLTAKDGDEPNEIQRGLQSANGLLSAAIDLERCATRLKTVQSLEKPVLDESVELGREILRKLKIQISPGGQTEGVDIAEARNEQARLMAKATDIYTDYLAAACVAKPEICNDPIILQANEAAGKLAYIVKAATVNALSETGDNYTAARLQKDISTMPANWKDVSNDTVEGLVDKIDKAYEYSAATLAQSFDSPKLAAASTPRNAKDGSGRTEEEAQAAQNTQILMEDERLRQQEQLLKAQNAAKAAAGVNKLKEMGVAEMSYEAPSAPKRDKDKPSPATSHAAATARENIKSRNEMTTEELAAAGVSQQR